jgi:hypothetical protein
MHSVHRGMVKVLPKLSNRRHRYAANIIQITLSHPLEIGGGYPIADLNLVRWGIIGLGLGNLVVPSHLSPNLPDAAEYEA